MISLDANGQQVEGLVKDQMNEEPLEDRFTSFGAKCVSCDGHDIDQIVRACRTSHKGKPLVVICRTCGYKGVPLLKEKYPYLHFVRISADEMPAYKQFYEEMGGER